MFVIANRLKESNSHYAAGDNPASQHSRKRLAKT